jgi:hypothetical protein
VRHCAELGGLAVSEEVTTNLGNVVVGDPEGLGALGWPQVALVILYDGAGLPLDAVRAVGEGRAVGLSSESLTPARLAGAMLRARVGVTESGAMGALEQAFGSRLPAQLVRAFLQDPARFTRLSDFVAVLPSRKRARSLLGDVGLGRAEHLATRMRCSLWRWLRQCGLRDRTIAEFLGVRDRANFRRACRRAKVGVPWR